jgi:hypothetical protein
MRQGIIAVITFATLSIIASEASAGKIQLHQHSQADLKATCDTNGGQSWSTSGSGASYGCVGPKGEVTCSKKDNSCVGYCPKCGAARYAGRLSVKSVLTTGATHR